METVPRVRFGLLPSDLEIRCTLTVQKNLPFFERSDQQHSHLTASNCWMRYHEYGGLRSHEMKKVNNNRKPLQLKSW